MSNYIGTYNGGRFWVDKPKVEDISLEELTHALVYNARFNGHTDIFWSVGQHSLLVEKIAVDLYRDQGNLCEKDLSVVKLMALTHDLSEGYMSDIARPFKKLLPDYLDFENRVQSCIYEFFGINNVDGRILDIISEADTIALATEANVLLNPCDEWVTDYEYMRDSREYKYRHLVKRMCPDLVQSILLYSIFKSTEKLGVNMEHKNNKEIYKEFRGLTKEYAIIKRGEKVGKFIIDGDKYKIFNHTKAIQVDRSDVDYLMDITKVLDYLKNR